MQQGTQAYRYVDYIYGVSSWSGHMPKSRLAQFPRGQAGSNHFGGCPTALDTPYFPLTSVRGRMMITSTDWIITFRRFRTMSSGDSKQIFTLEGFSVQWLNAVHGNCHDIIFTTDGSTARSRYDSSQEENRGTDYRVSGLNWTLML
jgi:hypothetical protein